jgi:hypothetical protein
MKDIQNIIVETCQLLLDVQRSFSGIQLDLPTSSVVPGDLNKYTLKTYKVSMHILHMIMK